LEQKSERELEKLYFNVAVSHQSVDQPTCRALERARSNLTSADRGGNSEVCVGCKLDEVQGRQGAGRFSVVGRKYKSIACC
jgi:hypothetical protein